MDKVGLIRFDGRVLDVYGSMDEPYFMANEVAKLIDYSIGNSSHMLNLVEVDERKMLSVRNSNTRARGNSALMWFVTEMGLYNILSQSRKPIARKWRRIIHSNIVLMRRQNHLSIEGQFDMWDAMSDDLYIEPETGVLMQSVTVAGGDVEQVPYVE